jgi:hypothetical protein
VSAQDGAVLPGQRLRDTRSGEIRTALEWTEQLNATYGIEGALNEVTRRVQMGVFQIVD